MMTAADWLALRDAACDPGITFREVDPDDPIMKDWGVFPVISRGKVLRNGTEAWGHPTDED